MNRKNAHLYLPLVRALSFGMTIQANRSPDPAGDPQWVDLDENEGEVLFTCAPELYRVKPEGVKE